MLRADRETQNTTRTGRPSGQNRPHDGLSPAPHKISADTLDGTSAQVTLVKCEQLSADCCDGPRALPAQGQRPYALKAPEAPSPQSFRSTTRSTPPRPIDP